jgi:hypothetical protein
MYRSIPTVDSITELAAKDGAEGQKGDEPQVKLIGFLKLADLYCDSNGYGQEISLRNRAILLLGFKCPIPLHPSDLVSLDIGDVLPTRDGVEIRLYRRASRPTQYVTISTIDDRATCTARLLNSWRGTLLRNGRATGPFFVRVERRVPLSQLTTKRLSAAEIVELVNNVAGWRRKAWNGEYKATTPLADFLVSFNAD